MPMPTIAASPSPRAVTRGQAPSATTRAPLDIASDHCKGGELCVTACLRHVLELDSHTVNALGYHPVRLVDPDGCTSCLLCAKVCPDAVFTVYAPDRTPR